MYFCMQRSISLPMQLSREIGRWLEGLEGSDFLKMGATLASFQESGKYELSKSLLKNVERGIESSCMPSFRSLGLTMSGPLALLGSKKRKSVLNVLGRYGDASKRGFRKTIYWWRRVISIVDS